MEEIRAEVVRVEMLQRHLYSSREKFRQFQFSQMPSEFELSHISHKKSRRALDKTG